MSALPQSDPQAQDRRRSFRAETLEKALRLVREELGPDAIVVRQREGVIGGVGGFFGRRCVELEVELPDAAPRPTNSKPSGLPDLDWAPSPDWLSTRARAVPAGVVVDLYDTGSPRIEPRPETRPDTEPGSSAEGEDAERYGWPAPDETPRGFVPLVPEQLEPAPAPGPSGQTSRPEQAEPDRAELDPARLEPTERAQPSAPEPTPEPVAAAVPEPPEPPEPVRPTEPPPEIAVEPTAAAESKADPEPSVALEPATAAEPELVDELDDEAEDGGELLRTLMAQASPFANEITAHMADHLATAHARVAFGRQLADRGLGDRLAREIVAEAETELRVFDPTQPFEDQVRAALARRIRVSRGSRRKRRVIALVGPPGSGKTLTAARLCHAYRSQRRDIAALSLQPIREAFRLVEHTRALDVPLVAADQLRTLPVELEKLDEVELLIVDTPGVQAGENERLRMLGALLELVGADETHLLVPASLDANQVRALVEAFSETLGANRIMITHLDGPGGPSAAVSVSIDSKLPISFTATGVSWGMHPADPHTLADLVIS